MRKRQTCVAEVRLQLNDLNTPEAVWTIKFLKDFADKFGNATTGPTKSIKNPEDILSLGAWWRPKNVQSLDIVEAYGRLLGSRKFKHATLSEICKPEMRQKLWNEMQDSCMQVANMTGGTVEDAALRAGDASAVGEIEAAIGYARQIILGRVGHLQMCPEQLAVLRSHLGSISPWVRCIMSNNDLVVLERFGAEAAKILAIRPDLQVLLGIPPYSCQLTPIMKCLLS